MNQLVRLGRTISEWPVASQQVARRNAMVALNDCTVRKVEREEVASFLAARTTRPTRTAAPGGTQAHA